MEALCRTGSLNGGFIRTRAAVSGARPAAANARAGAATSRTMQLTRVSSPLSGAFCAASPARTGSTSTRATSVPSTRRASDSPAAPTPAPRSRTRSPARAGHAAANKIASWPTRCPLRGCLSRSLPPSTASSVSSAGIRTEFVSETGVLQQFARVIDTTLAHQDAAREDADRTFEHAHVLIQHDVGDISGIEQSCHRRDQHGIIGPYELAPIVFVDLVVGLLQTHLLLK